MSKRRPEPQSPVFFIDRNLGRTYIVGALKDAGARVEAHDDHFDQDTLDTEWLPEVGRRGWVLLTKDREILRRTLEKRALEEAQVSAFFLSRGDMTGEQMANAFLAALPRICRLLRQYRLPVIGTVAASGAVTIKIGERRGGPKGKR